MSIALWAWKCLLRECFKLYTPWLAILDNGKTSILLLSSAGPSVSVMPEAETRTPGHSYSLHNTSWGWCYSHPLSFTIVAYILNWLCTCNHILTPDNQSWYGSRNTLFSNGNLRWKCPRIYDAITWYGSCQMFVSSENCSVISLADIYFIISATTPLTVIAAGYAGSQLQSFARDQRNWK